jgi:DNA-binding MarR family transcriptional regulator
VESPPSRLSAKPSWLITQLAVHARRLVYAGFAEADARGYHYRLLAALQEFGPMSQAVLGRRCSVDRSDVVNAINELTGQGSVERAPDPADRRRNTVTITDEGRSRLRRMDEVLDRVQDDLLAPLSADERRLLVALLGRLLEHHSGQVPGGDA